MGNPLLSRTTSTQASATIFLVLRRMRTPLIVLIVIFAVSVLGLTLIPGRYADGQPWRMGFFDAFYFMSYTATTIGFGELPHGFNDAQRLWVTFSIYLTVIGWAYAIGSLLTLLQDRAFRQALTLQRFTRRVARLREPFLLVAGYGETGQLLGRALDALDRRFVVVDRVDTRIDALDLEAYRADVPGLAGDVRNPAILTAAGLDHPRCEGVLALTDDDEANLAVAMTASLLRPDLLVMARTVSARVAERMAAFGRPMVIDPFDRFGERLCLGFRAPASVQLMTWLASAPGSPLPARREPPPRGRWVVCGYGRFGQGLVSHLRAEGLEVTVVDPRADPTAEGLSVVAGDGFDPGELERAGIGQAAAFVAATDSDTTNLSLVVAARRLNPRLLVTARQNSPDSSPLFDAVDIDHRSVQSEVVVREALARLANPLLWQFLQAVPAEGDAWAGLLVDALVAQCGPHVPSLWQTRLSAAEAPALQEWLAAGDARLGDLLRDPEDRERRIAAVPLMVRRAGGCLLWPADDTELEAGDDLLLAGRPSAHRSLEATLFTTSTSEYVTAGRHVPSGWLLRRLSRDRVAWPR